MSRTEIVELTVLCFISDGDKVLLQNRVKEDWKKWCTSAEFDEQSALQEWRSYFTYKKVLRGEQWRILV